MLLFYLSLIETEEDKAKFERLYNQYRNLMKSIALDKLGDDWFAEDAVNDAFVKLARHVKTIDEDNCHKTKGLFVIVIKNICKDKIRKERSRQEKLISIDEVENITYNDEDSFKSVE